MKKVFRSLPPELAADVARLLLADDVVDYMAFRAVCSEWRSCTASPRGLDSCFRPRRWIMLTDGDAHVHTKDRSFLNLSTGRSLCLRHLVELDTHSVLSDSDGLLVLVDNSTRIVRLFNPFTRHLSDLPPLPTVHGADLEIPSMINLFTSSISSGSCPTVVLFSPHLHAAYFAKPGEPSWKFHFFAVSPNSMLFFEDRFYFADRINGVQCIELEQHLVKSLIRPWPLFSGKYDYYYLAEYNKRMLLIYRKATNNGPFEPKNQTFQVYSIDLESKWLLLLIDHRDLALFVGLRGRSLALSLKGLPSIKGNSIYFCTGIQRNPIIIRDINYHRDVEFVLTDVALHDGHKRINPSIRPFTLAHHLATYCVPLNWSIGLMWHEFMEFPKGWVIRGCNMEDFKQKYSIF